MKKKFLTVVMATVMTATLLVGCGSKDDSNTSSASVPVSKDTTVSSVEVSASVSSAEEEKSDEQKVDEVTTHEKPAVEKDYKDVLNKIYDYLAAYDNDSDFDDETIGIFEEAQYTCDNRNVFDHIGYTMVDINNDGTKELIITCKGYDREEGSRILALYTYEGAEPKLVASGYARNELFLLEGGDIYNSGSSGALFSSLSRMTLEKDKAKLTTSAFFFTDVDETTDEMVFFSNPEGVADPSHEKSTEVTAQAFNEFAVMCESVIDYKSFTPFKNYNYTGSEDYSYFAEKAHVTAFWADDTMPETPDYVMEGSSIEGAVMFATDKPVKDFKIFTLSFVDFTDDGKYYFTEDLLKWFGDMTPERDFTVQFAFPGDLPSAGFSYKDLNGDFHRFMIGISGMDGSLYIEEF